MERSSQLCTDEIRHYGTLFGNKHVIGKRCGCSIMPGGRGNTHMYVHVFTVYVVLRVLLQRDWIYIMLFLLSHRETG
jgi:hypothetical protein